MPEIEDVEMASGEEGAPGAAPPGAEAASRASHPPSSRASSSSHIVEADLEAGDDDDDDADDPDSADDNENGDDPDPDGDNGDPEDQDSAAAVDDDDDDDEDDDDEDTKDEDIELPPAAGTSPAAAPPPGGAAAAVAAGAVAPAAGASSSSADAPASAPASTPAAAPATAPAKKVKRAPRSPSLPPPPPPPARTVRLEIRLGGPEAYEVDIAALLKATGQREGTPVPLAKREESESEADAGVRGGEGDDEADAAKGEEGKEKPKPKRKKNKNLYDLEDPFIDDSDLAIDERTFFAQTKQQGFYVSSGEVALLKEKTPKKPKSKRLPLLAISASISSSSALKPRADNGASALASGALASAALAGAKAALPTLAPHDGAAPAGTRDSPIALLSDGEGEDDKLGVKRKASANGAPGDGRAGKKRRVDIRPFSPELEAEVEGLKAEIAKQNWDNKSRFPPALKPVLVQVAVAAIRLNEYDDNLFNLMPKIFPYNRFTMVKLIKRLVFVEHTRILTERQDELLKELARVTHEGFPKAKDEYEKAVLAWEKKQEKAKAEAESAAGSGSAEGTPALANGAANGHTPTPTPTPVPAAALAVPADGDDGDAEHTPGPAATQAGKKEEKEREAKPPTRKFRLTDEMKGILWALVCLSNECVRLENEKNSLEGAKEDTVSEQGHRKVLYQKIVAAFPEGWSSSQQISREVSALKKKAEREAMDLES